MSHTKEEKILQALQWGNLQGSPTGIIALDSSGANIYPIDLETRKITAPAILGVQHDHQSNIVYFSVPRYFRNMDLSTTTIIITYEDVKNNKYAYVVPYVDITTYYDYQRPYVKDVYGNILYIPEYQTIKTTITGEIVDGMVISSRTKLIPTLDTSINQFKTYYALNENNDYIVYEPTTLNQLRDCYESVTESTLKDGTLVYEHYKTPDGLQVFRDFNQKGLMIIPWCISGILMQFSGSIKFALKFFKTIVDNPNTTNESQENVLLYELNTLPATSKILEGFDEKGLFDENYTRFKVINIDDEEVVEPINQILLDSTLWHNLESLITNSGNLQIYWNELQNDIEDDDDESLTNEDLPI